MTNFKPHSLQQGEQSNMKLVAVFIIIGFVIHSSSPTDYSYTSIECSATNKSATIMFCSVNGENLSIGINYTHQVNQFDVSYDSCQQMLPHIFFAG